MRILYHGLVELDTHTAPSVHTRMICQALADLGHEVLLACPRAGFRSHPRGVQVAGLPFLGFSLPRLVLYREMGGRAIQRLARNFEPDVIVDRMSPMLPKLADVADRLDVPLALEVNGRMAAKDYLFGSTIRQGARRALRSRRLTVIGCSPGIAAEFRTDVKASAEVPFVVVENGVDPALVTAAAKPSRSDLGLREERFVVGFLGHFNRAYDFEGMLAGCRVAVDRGLDLHFYLGATPDLQQEISRIADSLQMSERLTCGPVVPHRHVAGVLRNFDAGIVHLVPERAHMAPTAFKLREMLLSGVPVLCDVTDHWPDWSLEQSIHALRGGGSEEIADHLCDIANDREQAAARAEQGARILRERYDWKVIGGAYAAVLERAAGRGAEGTETTEARRISGASV